MYYAYTYDICECIMCHDNKIFESLKQVTQHYVQSTKYNPRRQ